MRKTALISAVLFFAAMSVTAALSATANTRAVMVFDEPALPAAEITEQPETPIETIRAIGTLDAVTSEASNPFEMKVQEALCEFVFARGDAENAPVELADDWEYVPVGIEYSQPAETVTVAAADENGGLLASAFIDSSKPLLQKPSGTLAKGPFAPSVITLTDEERDLVERVIYSEVSGRSRIDALAVAQCIYDRCIEYKKSVTAVLTQPYQFARPTYKYTPTQIVKDAVSDVFDRGVRLTEEKLLYFYALYVINPNSFHETQRCLLETDIHRYFGPW